MKLSKDVGSLNSSELNTDNTDLQQTPPEDTATVEQSRLNNSSFESINPPDELTNQNDSSNFLVNSNKTSPDLPHDSKNGKISSNPLLESKDDKTIFEPASDSADKTTLSDSTDDSKDNKTSSDLNPDSTDDLTLPDAESNDQEIISPSVADSATNKSADTEDSILNRNATLNKEDTKDHHISSSYETVGIFVIVAIMLTVGLAIAKKRGYICSEYEDVYDRSASYQHNTTPNLGVPSEKYDPL